MNKYVDTSYVDIAVKHYRKLGLAFTEALLEAWLTPGWDRSPYRDVLIPTLIGRKLEINEQEY